MLYKYIFIIKYEYEDEYEGGCWCAGIVLMVVVVVAVGGVCTCLLVYHGEPHLPSAMWINMWKDQRAASDRNTVWDGPAMCKIGKTKKRMG